MSATRKAAAPTILLLATLPLVGCERHSPPQTAPAAPTPQPGSTPSSRPEVTGFEPITYFENRCARCHGPYGSFYGDEFAAMLDDAHLREVVHDMVFGAAQSTLSDAEIDLLTAYHRGMRSGEPFILITSSGPPLSGEVTPGATVHIHTAAGARTATVEDHRWTLPGVSLDDAQTIEAELSGRTTRLDPGQAIGSHE